ncbi:MAG: hypothetical protein PHS02_03750, partial [Candidatus ainarchaeum sp.]|nr:hypothetical protein [Candidatus ainarchaeum sp.]
MRPYLYFLILAFLMSAVFAVSNVCVGATQNFTCGDTVTESCTLDGNISIDDSTCFSIGANDIELDCAGFTISGNGAPSAYGIYMS